MRFDRRELAAIFAGGFIGAIARAELVQALPHDSSQWPWATFIANIAGAAMLGCFATWLAGRRPPASYALAFLGTGVCGALTTFSTMQIEIVRMLGAAHIGLATVYTAASVGAGLLVMTAATRLTRRMRRPV
jgi:CrcB protein